MTAIPKPAAPAMLCVYNTAGRCIGFILNRYRDGFRAHDTDGKAIGVYPTQREAAEAVRAFSGGAP
jgi:hypothetical protein